MTDADTTIEYFFDIGSPYSYLASTRLEKLERDTGASVDWRPFLLGGVFKETGNSAPARIDEKARYMLQDLRRWAEHYGIPFQMSPHFPVNTLQTQRALVVAKQRDSAAVPTLARDLFRRCWVEGEDVSDPEVIREAAAGIDVPSQELIDRTADQVIKDRLREVTEEAVDRGAFGAPTFFVDDEMFWGNDRLRFVRKAAAASQN